MRNKSETAPDRPPTARQRMAVVEAHGIFQFADDLFEEGSACTREEALEPQKYTPRQVHPQWYFAEPYFHEADQRFDPLICKFQADHFFAKKDYPRALKTYCDAFACIKAEKPRCKSSLFRELVEGAIRCHLNLDSASEAIRLLTELDQCGVEDPGLYWLKAHVYEKAGEPALSAQAARDFLRLRPGDEIATSLISRLEPPPKTYLCRFAQTRESFRLPELVAIGSAQSISLEFVGEYSDASPFLAFKTSASIQAILDRAVLVKDFIELWAEADSLDAIHGLLKLGTHHYEPLCRASFRFVVKCFGATVSEQQQRQMIDSFAYMNLTGKVVLSGECDVVFGLFVDARHSRFYFGRWIGNASRSLVDKFTLKKRAYLGTTSMDAELSLIMANMARVKPGDLVYDPFVGTGSLLYPPASFGAYAIGSDIDGRQIRGRDSVSIYTNLERYNVEQQMLGALVSDFARNTWRSALKFDAIITDPPYGVRAGARRLGSKAPGQRAIPADYRDDSYPETIPYELDHLIGDLLDFAEQRLVVGGRLVFWYPVIFGEDRQPPAIDPCVFILTDARFSVVADSPQRLCGMIRRLITLERRVPPLCQ